MRSPCKERYLNALKHADADEIPFQENQFDITHLNRELGRNYPLSTRHYETAPEDQVEFALRVGNDMLHLASVWELGRQVTIDEAGRKHYVNGEIKTPEALRDIVDPDVGEFERLIDGNIVDLIPKFIELGTDIINPIEPSENQDIVDLKRRFGDHVAFQGNLDVASILSVESPETVRRQAEELIRAMAPGGGFILASSHDISEDVPWESVLAMRDAAFNFKSH